MSTKKTRLAIRGWKRGQLVFEDCYEVTPDSLEFIAATAAERHADVLTDNGRAAPHLIEFEWLDEPDPLQRFTRIGTDPSAMVQPIAVSPSAFMEDCAEPLTHCEECGCPLKGDATNHSPECPWTKLAQRDAKVREVMQSQFALPTHCEACGAYLMGGATKHSPECPLRRLIDEILEEHFPKTRTVQ